MLKLFFLSCLDFFVAYMCSFLGTIRCLGFYPRLLRLFHKLHGFFGTLVAHVFSWHLGDLLKLPKFFHRHLGVFLRLPRLFPRYLMVFPKLPMPYHRHFGLFPRLFKVFNMFEFFLSY